MVRNIVFRNNDRFAIKHLLIQIGEATLSNNCWNKKLNKPRQMNQFFIEADQHRTMLKYRYPEKGVVGIMEIDNYDLPENGWIRVQVR